MYNMRIKLNENRINRPLLIFNLIGCLYTDIDLFFQTRTIINLYEDILHTICYTDIYNMKTKK